MFKRTFLATAIGAAMMLGSVGSASALEITAGNYKITLDNYDSGTTGYGNTASIKCESVAACNLVPGIKKAVGTSSDTAGIFSVAAITNVSTGFTQYTRGTASTLGDLTFGPYLTGVFGGLNDYYVEVATLGGAPSTLTKSLGGFFNLYSNGADYDPTLGPMGTGVNLDDKTYEGITGGALLLGGNFAAGAVRVGDLTSTYTTLYDNATTGGSSEGYLDFTSGSALKFFNTNSLTNKNGGKNDAFLKVGFDDAGGEASAIGWTVKSVGQVSGEVGEVPEPSSIALLSLAMLGLGAFTRRRNKQG